MSKADIPPVPPASRSPKGPGDQEKPSSERIARRRPTDNTAEQDRQGNIKENTTHQGYQQDR